jgi:hypothetical protein
MAKPKRMMVAEIPPEWHLLINESRNLNRSGILIFKTPFCEMLFVKVMEFNDIIASGGRCIFEVLTKEAILKLGNFQNEAQIQESFLIKELKQPKKPYYVEE